MSSRMAQVTAKASTDDLVGQVSNRVTSGPSKSYVSGYREKKMSTTTNSVNKSKKRKVIIGSIKILVLSSRACKYSSIR